MAFKQPSNIVEGCDGCHADMSKVAEAMADAFKKEEAE